MWTQVLLVVLAPVAAEHSSGVFVLVQDFTVDGPDDAVATTTIKTRITAKDKHDAVVGREEEALTRIHLRCR